MNHWIFIVTQQKADDITLAPDDILKQRMEDKFWGLGEKTPNRRYLQRGDKVVFYLGNPRKVFAATATLVSVSFQPTKEQQAKYDHGISIYRPEYAVFLESVQVWDAPRPVEDLVPSLKFIENKDNWFAYFQGGVRQVSEEDFRTITEGYTSTPSARVPSTAEIISESQFVLESHLEEFIDQNWEKIDFGAPLSRYAIEDQNGRQFPAGPWSIDFLCVDKNSGDLVVIELKRGKSSDSTVGQILRYIGWVKENLAEQNQNVRGIIIAQENDSTMRYAIKDLPHVTALTYKVNFTLSKFEK